jgi:putative addiction module component (TIGR02574 family)
MHLSKELLFKEVMNLPPLEKVKLVEYILESFSLPDRKGIDEAWIKEVEARYIAFQNGEMKKSSMEDVFAEIDK